jgi:tetratricopeptide (TPR) repeat protein
MVLQEYRRNLNPRQGDTPALERATRAARHAIEAKPASARAYQALMEVQFQRGEYALALASGAKAVQLNPYNQFLAARYGARLVGLGELEKGARYLKEAAAGTAVRPAWIDFYLFLAAYLTGDRATAETYAAQIVSEKSPGGLVARALVALQRGQPDVARLAIDRLIELQPGWRDDPRAELKKSLPADAVANRIARDLAQAGLSAMN